MKIILTTVSTLLLLFLASCAPAPQVHVATPTPKPTPAVCKAASFETGIDYPRWSTSGYSDQDQEWTANLSTLHAQTDACWVGMEVLFGQSTLTSTTITGGSPTAPSLAQGIAAVHAQGLHVALSMLLDVKGPQTWAGAIRFASYARQQAWFQSYWRAIQPYAVVAEQEHAEQFAFGTEESDLQRTADPTLWFWLIEQIRAVYHGTLVYNMNWTDLPLVPPGWMRSVSMIGVSTYLPQVDTEAALTPAQIDALWTSQAIPRLDQFAQALGQPIFISEIGYRDTADTFHTPWSQLNQYSAPIDQDEQAAACAAAIHYARLDPHVRGMFFWAWTGAGLMSLQGSPAVAAIKQGYSAA